MRFDPGRRARRIRGRPGRRAPVCLRRSSRRRRPRQRTTRSRPRRCSRTGDGSSRPGKLRRSLPQVRRQPAPRPLAGTLLNLANCYEKLGRTATAWATYREAASAANAAGRSDYVATAQRHADALAPHLARLTVSVAQPVDGLLVMRDGVARRARRVGRAHPDRPRVAHASRRARPGTSRWTSHVDVRAGRRAGVRVGSAARGAARRSGAGSPAAVVRSAGPSRRRRRPLERGLDGSGNRQRCSGSSSPAAASSALGVATGLRGERQVPVQRVARQLPARTTPTRATAPGVSQRDSARTAGNVRERRCRASGQRRSSAAQSSGSRRPARSAHPGRARGHRADARRRRLCKEHGDMRRRVAVRLFGAVAVRGGRVGCNGLLGIGAASARGGGRRPGVEAPVRAHVRVLLQTRHAELHGRQRRVRG